MMFTLLILSLLVFLTIYGLSRMHRQNKQATRRRKPARQKYRSKLYSSDKSSKPDVLESTMPNHEITYENQPEIQTLDEGLEHVVLYIMAPKNMDYNGYELLQALLANSFRYGDRNIFHRYETTTGRGRILFSLASVNKPGTFELTKMGSFTCPGLVLFLLLKNVSDPLAAFDMMLESAHQLTEDLGGEIWDQDKKLLTKDKIDHIRADIHRFVESKHMPDLFANV